MRSTKWLLLLTGLVPGMVRAATDKPIMAPPPDWVKPVAIPAKPDKADEAPIRILLIDQQSKLEPGRVINYADVALYIQTPQGLSAGNLSLPWNPQTDDLTVHKLVIHRDGKDIDVLAEGQTFTVVRRETNLEIAALDGMLTANIQPEGLQVGDILEYAITVSRSDPVLKGHVEQVGAAWNGVSFTRAHTSVQWPSSMTVAIRQSGPLPPVKPVKSGNITKVEISSDNIEPIIPPAGAPSRFARGRAIEFSDFKSWADLGALMAPLYAQAAVIPAQGPLRNELEKIKAASTDPVKRAEAALALVQDRVRYVALLMGVGGLTPAKAEETWARRYGDCKAKSALLLALLSELGIEAEPVAANALSGDGLDERLPMVGLFNHVLVRAHIAGRTYWLDGTRSGDASLARLQVPYFNWGLPLVAQGAALVRMMPDPLDQPGYDLSIDLDARGGLTLPALAKAQVILRGDEATGARLGLANLTGEARDKALRDYWKERLDDIEITKVSASFDPANGTEVLTMEGKAKMDWSDAQYWTDWTHVGFEADYSRTAGSDNGAPFAIDYPSYSRTTETIQLPPGFSDANIFRKDPINETVAGIEYRRNSSLTDNVFRIERTTRAVAPEFAAKDAPAAQKRLRELSDLAVSIRKPDGYRMTSSEMDAQKAQTLTTAKAYVDRGLDFFRNGRLVDAKADYGAAIALDAKYVWAFANRALVSIDQNDLKSAQQDIDAAAFIDPENSVLWHARGRLASTRKAWPDAVAAFSHSIANDPKDSWALGQRAWAYRQLGQYQPERADLTELLKLEPANENARANLISSYGTTGDYETSTKLAADVDLTTIKTANLANSIAIAWLQHREPGKAIAALTRSFELQPDQVAAFALRARANLLSGNRDAALADVDAGMKLDSKSLDLQSMRALVLISQNKRDEARKQAQSMIDANPDRVDALLSGGAIFLNLGDADKALAAFNAAVKQEPDNISARTALSQALVQSGDKEAAAKTAGALPLADIKDLSQLTMIANAAVQRGDYPAAIAALSRSLELSPGQAQMLAYRAHAYQASGNRDAALADAAASLKVDPKQPDVHLMRVNILRGQGKRPEALAETEDMLKVDPESAYAHIVAAKIFDGFGQHDRGMAEIDRAIALKPDAMAYANRAAMRPKSDLAGRLADFDAALKLEPDLEDALSGKAQIQVDRGDFSGAVKSFTALLDKWPKNPWVRNSRGIVYAKSGDSVSAEADFAEARKASEGEAGLLNNLCYDKATAGVALDQALDECDAALVKEPGSAGIMDSKAFVLLRLNRLDEAISIYDSVLAKQSSLAPSLLGRAIAWSRKGDKAKAKGDRDAALKLDPNIEKKFEGYGVIMGAAKVP